MRTSITTSRSPTSTGDFFRNRIYVTRLRRPSRGLLRTFDRFAYNIWQQLTQAAQNLLAYRLVVGHIDQRHATSLPGRVLRRRPGGRRPGVRWRIGVWASERVNRRPVSLNVMRGAALPRRSGIYVPGARCQRAGA